MNRHEFETRLADLLDSPFRDAAETMEVVVVPPWFPYTHQEELFDESNDGKAWTDAELRFILKTVPSKENRVLLARTLKRNVSSIEAIFRWAAEY